MSLARILRCGSPPGAGGTRPAVNRAPSYGALGAVNGADKLISALGTADGATREEGPG